MSKFTILLEKRTVCLNSNSKIRSNDENTQLLQLKRSVENTVSNKESLDHLDEPKFFNNLYETVETTKFQVVKKRKNEILFTEIKDMLTKLIEKVNTLEKERNEWESSSTVGISSTDTLSTEHIGPMYYTPKSFLEVVNKRHGHKVKRQRWGRWTEWSACSVSCGKGREIRWRHCLESCDEVETEMEEKACQLPACGPGKIFGIQL